MLEECWAGDATVIDFHCPSIGLAGELLAVAIP